MADAGVKVKVEERRDGRVARVTVDNSSKLNCLSTPLIVAMTEAFARLGEGHRRKSRGADVVVTVTPARTPIVMADWIAPGTHIAAIGADKKGDQELEGRLLKNARIFVDDIRQCRTDGEINVPLSQGLITEAHIAGSIGEIITGKKAGRTSDDEITIFDSTGIALQDSATVPLEYQRAMAAGVGVEKKMIST